MTAIKHFEEVYEEAESLAVRTSSKDIDKIIVELNNILSEYQSFNKALLPPELKQPMKARKFGEILFKLCEISALDNINAYSSLAEEIKINSEF
jgi:hypothetical protein